MIDMVTLKGVKLVDYDETRIYILTVETLAGEHVKIRIGYRGGRDDPERMVRHDQDRATVKSLLGKKVDITYSKSPWSYGDERGTTYYMQDIKES